MDDRIRSPRERLFRQAAVLQLKLVADGLRDAVLIPVSLVAAAVGLLRGGDDCDTEFRRVIDLGRRSERWINLFGHEEPLLPEGETEPSLLDSTEVGGPVPLSHVTPGEAPVDASEMPEWLRDLKDQEPHEDMEPPIWLTEPDAEIPAELPAEEIPHVQEDTPGWMAGLPSVEQDSPTEDTPE